MTDIMIWMWAGIIAVGICSLVITPLLLLIYKWTHIKISELRDKIN
jgi:hypothetical protein